MKSYLRKICGLDRLYNRKYGVAYLMDILLVVVAVLIVNSYMNDSPYVNYDRSVVVATMVILIFISSLYFIQELIQSFTVSYIIKSRHYTSDNVHPWLSQFIDSSVNTELEVYDNIRTISSESQFVISDVRFDFYRRTKHGQYKSKEAFYTVIEYHLPRHLPHLVFDSKRAKGRQFDTLFVGSQKLTLEGNFSDYYDVYSPKFYQIDTLSFITPEVMQSMLSMTEYDFEIKGDSLLCYSPLLTNDEIAKLQAKTYDLFANLQNNLESYRDDRLDYQQSKANVSDFGRALLISPKRYMAGLIFSGLASSLFVYVAYSYNDLTIFRIPQVSFIVLFFIYSVIRIVMLLKKNARLETEFRQQHQSLEQN